MTRLLFLTLNTFSATGGIEKVCRVAGKALHEISADEGSELSIWSMYDSQAAMVEDYFPASIFKGFGGKKGKFVLEATRRGVKSDVVILSHINLLMVGFLVKKLSPKTKIILVSHGIEVWAPLSSLKNKMLRSVDLFLPVSHFTKQKLQSVLNIPAEKMQVMNNCLDPFMKKTSDRQKELDLASKYELGEGPVLLTLTRLKFSEQYKGYDKVIESLSLLRKSLPGIKYLVVGRYDEAEKARLDQLIEKAGLHDTVIFTGYVSDEDLASHFNLADIYIMPSTGEGFGIVFIEALFHGMPVIAGNKDGSVDALANGEFGLLVDPGKKEAIIEAVLKMAANKQAFVPDEKKLAQKFGFENYKRQWHRLLFPDGKNRKTNDRNKEVVTLNSSF